LKRKGRHPHQAFTAVKVKQTNRPGRYADGNGLYLVVDESGAKRWILRIVIQKRRRDLGLGSARLVPLAEAREKALTYRKTARDGKDPAVEKRLAERAILTFAEGARIIHAEHCRAWKNKKHAAQWIKTLEIYSFPFIGACRLDQIETADILRVLAPIWLKKPETARRVRQRIGVVMDWAKASGHRSGENPVDGVTKGLQRQQDRPKHHTALKYSELPKFIRSLRKADVALSVKLAFEFLVLTAARTGEVLGAKWNEINLSTKTWEIPAERMKAGIKHRVPLSSASLLILRNAKKLTDGSEFVFPGRTSSNPLSNMAFLMTLRRMRQPVTTHGFRSTFRDWASAKTNTPREVSEMALAHTVSNKTEAAYLRDDLFDKRRKLMEAWAQFIQSRDNKARDGGRK
jgi:integrase